MKPKAFVASAIVLALAAWPAATLIAGGSRPPAIVELSFGSDTVWSVVYDLRDRGGLVAVREDYRTQYRFGFPKEKP